MARKKSMKKSTHLSMHFKDLFVFPFWRRIALAAVATCLIAGGLGIGATLKIHHHLQTMFPMTEVGRERMIGYAQYFNYPIYYENVLFLGLLAFPFFVFGAVWIWERKST